jgi:hypothetical protein
LFAGLWWCVQPQLDTHIQIGPTGRKLLPLTVTQPAAGANAGS